MIRTVLIWLSSLISVKGVINSGVRLITEVIARIMIKSIKKAKVLFLNAANGRCVLLFSTSATSAHPSTSCITLTALSPARLNLYFPDGACSMNGANVLR